MLQKKLIKDMNGKLWDKNAYLLSSSLDKWQNRKESYYYVGKTQKRIQPYKDA